MDACVNTKINKNNIIHGPPTERIGGRRLGLLVHARPVLEGLKDELLEARDGGGEVPLGAELADAEEGEVAG